VKNKTFKSLKALALSIAIILPLVITGCFDNSESKQTDNTITPAMWKVSSKDGDTDLYLFGSIHAADDTSYPLPKKVMDAYESSDYLAVEADIVAFEKDLTAQTKMALNMAYTDGTTIQDHISAETYTKIKEVLTENKLYNEVYEMYKPALWTSLLDSIIVKKSGLDPEKGIDSFLLKKAKKDEKQILEVESIEFQTDMLLGFSDEIQELMLKGYTKDLDTQVGYLEQLYAIWQSGDAEKIAEFGEEEDDEFTDAEKALYEDYNKEMLTDRNIGMADKAEEYLESGKKTFFVVGAMHMVGDDGLVALLEEKGYTVTAVK